MAYKDSFVDEYPYLVYSDDPEAVGGAGGAGGDIGITPDETASNVDNTSGRDVTDAVILVDAEGKKTIAVFPVASGKSVLIAPNAYIGLPEDFHIHVGAIDTGSNLEPAGTFTVALAKYKSYQLSDPDKMYSILAS